MSEHRIKSQNSATAGSTTANLLIAVDAAWVLSLDDQPPVDKHGVEQSISIEAGDVIVVGVDGGVLSSIAVSFRHPSGRVDTLSDATTTDGEVVTAANAAGDEKPVNVKVVHENDLPDPS